MQELEGEIHKQFEDLRQAKLRISTLEHRMKEKAEKTALHEVEESLKLLPSRDEVIEMRTNVRENIARF